MNINPLSRTSVTNQAILCSRIASRWIKASVMAMIVSASALSSSHAILRVTIDLKAVQTGLTATSDGIVTLSPNGSTVVVAPGAHVVIQLVATLNATDGDLTAC